MRFPLLLTIEWNRKEVKFLTSSISRISNNNTEESSNDYWMILTGKLSIKKVEKDLNVGSSIIISTMFKEVFKCFDLMEKQNTLGGKSQFKHEVKLEIFQQDHDLNINVMLMHATQRWSWKKNRNSSLE